MRGLQCCLYILLEGSFPQAHVDRWPIHLREGTEFSASLELHSSGLPKGHRFLDWPEVTLLIKNNTTQYPVAI